MKFSIKDFFSKYDQICSFLRIWSHLQKKSFIENFIFYAVVCRSKWWGFWFDVSDVILANLYFWVLNICPSPLVNFWIFLQHQMLSSLWNIFKNIINKPSVWFNLVPFTKTLRLQKFPKKTFITLVLSSCKSTQLNWNCQRPT